MAGRFLLNEYAQTSDEASRAYGIVWNPMAGSENISSIPPTRITGDEPSHLQAQARLAQQVCTEPSGEDHRHHEDATTKSFFRHSSGRRTNTDAVVTAALAKQYPNLEIVVTPAGNSNLLGYAGAGNASYEPVKESRGELPDSLQWDIYIPPARRLDGAIGGLGALPIFGKYLYKWRDTDFIVYFVDGRDGSNPYPSVTNFYILTPDKGKAQQLILEAGLWTAELHKEVWVYDSGFWQKSRELYESIQNSTWDSVILSPEMKESLIEDHLSFFNSRETYSNLKVPWKRGIIYYGPPGNGKTISIKATMNMLYNHKPAAIPTLYVRSLFSVGAISAVSSIA